MKEDVARKAGRGHTSNAGQGSGRAPFPEPENQRPAVLQPRPTQPRALGPGASRARGLEGACCLSVAPGPLRTSRQPLAEDRVWRGPAASTPSGEAEARNGCAAPPAPAHGSPAPTLFDWTGCGADWLTPVFSGRGEGWTSSAMSGAVGDPTGPEGWRAPSVSLPQRVSAFAERGKEGGRPRSRGVLERSSSGRPGTARPDAEGRRGREGTSTAAPVAPAAGGAAPGSASRPGPAPQAPEGRAWRLPGPPEWAPAALSRQQGGRERGRLGGHIQVGLGPWGEGRLQERNQGALA